MIWGSDRRLARVALAALLTISTAKIAHAQQVDDATRASARQLGDEAKALYDKGDFAGALERYERADALVHLPTIGVRVARCLVKLGRLVEANERYLAVSRMELPANALSVHKEAQEEAEKERNEIAPRIAGVVLHVVGVTDATVTIDGQAVPKALLGAKRAIDPGKHHVEARAGDASLIKDFAVKDGEVIDLPLPLQPSTTTPTATVPPPPPPPPPPLLTATATPTATADDRKSGSAQRTIGFIGIGAGGVVLIGGVVAGIGAISQKSHIESRCGSELACGPAYYSDADGYNRLRTLSSIGIVGGLGLAAVGTILVFTSPKDHQVALDVGPSRATLRGSF